MALSRIKTNSIADNAVTSPKISDSTVVAADIAPLSVDSTKLAANSVTTAKITDGNVTAAKIADANVTYAKLSSDVQRNGMRNRIINGAMVIDQRNAGAVYTTSPVNNQYTLDRWQAAYVATSKFTVQQSSVAPVGHLKSLLVTSSAATSLSATDYYIVSQAIEGFNIADLGWGTANAKTVTVSFWVYSSLTGTFGGALNNGGFNRGYPFSYTISSANTWQQINITIAGDTTGTWATDNSIGMYIMFSLGSGSTPSGTPGSWGASGYRSATGAVSVVGTSGATWYITGVQIEAGSTATNFEYRQYGTELALCQRYYNNLNWAGNQWYQNTTTSYVGINYPAMRASPTITSAGATCQYGPGGQLSASASAYGATGTTYSGMSLVQSGGGAANSSGFSWGNAQLNAEI